MATKILYVGNNLADLKSLSLVVQLTDYQLFHGKSIHEGVALAVRKIPDLILINTSIYSSDGVDIMTYLKNMPVFDATLIVAVSDNIVSFELTKQYKEIGFTDVISNKIDGGIIQYLNNHKRRTITRTKADQRPKHILIATDNPALRIQLTHTFTSPDNVTQAKNTGVEAIKSLQTNIPDVLVIDMSLPTVYGVLSYVRHHKRTSHIKIVALTDNDWSMQNYETRYADTFLTKPVNSEELRMAVQHFFVEAPNSDNV